MARQWRLTARIAGTTSFSCDPITIASRGVSPIAEHRVPVKPFPNGTNAARSNAKLRTNACATEALFAEH
jgi:hypothetical protein